MLTDYSPGFADTWEVRRKSQLAFQCKRLTRHWIVLYLLLQARLPPFSQRPAASKLAAACACFLKDRAYGACILPPPPGFSLSVSEKGNSFCPDSVSLCPDGNFYRCRKYDNLRKTMGINGLICLDGGIPHSFVPAAIVRRPWLGAWMTSSR